MKILIADDHSLFRDSLALFIERARPDHHVEFCKDFVEVKEALASGNKYDLILLDLRMPGMSGINGLHFVRDNYPQTKVALMSGIAEDDDIKEALAVGAVGYFPKTLSGKDFVDAINKVLSGEFFFPLDSNNKSFKPSYYEDEINLPPQGSETTKTINEIGLSPRETEVLSFLVRGESNKEIARALDLQVVTVKLHVRGICKKLGAKNRTHAAMKAKDFGIANKASNE